MDRAWLSLAGVGCCGQFHQKNAWSAGFFFGQCRGQYSTAHNIWGLPKTVAYLLVFVQLACWHTDVSTWSVGQPWRLSPFYCRKHWWCAHMSVLANLQCSHRVVLVPFCRISKRIEARLSWVLLTAGGTHGHSLRLGEFEVDFGTCHSFLYACTKIFCRPSNTLCNNSIRAAKNRKASIPFCKCSAERSSVSGWLLTRSRATLAFYSDYPSCGAHVIISRAPVT